MPIFTKIFEKYFRNQLYVKGERQLVPSWAVNKLKVAEFCVNNDIPHGEVYKTWENPNDISFVDLPESFVIKPSNLNSSRGVQVLERTNREGEFFDHYAGKLTSLQEVIQVQASELEKIEQREAHRLKTYRVMAQERMVDKGECSGSATDIKFWLVGKKVKYIRVNGGGHYKKIPICFYDENFDPLFDGNGKVYLKESAIPIPHRIYSVRDRVAMLDLAEHIARVANQNFLRVDLFLTNDGPKLGEITPVPGSPYNGQYFGFEDGYDDEMGHEWAESLGVTVDELFEENGIK